MRYADYDDVKARYGGDAPEEKIRALLDEAGLIIDAYNKNADQDAKRIVSTRMVIRALGSDGEVPIGTTQGTVSALGYSQTWTMSGGSTGELYISKIDKKLLGVGTKLGFVSPWEDARC